MIKTRGYAVMAAGEPLQPFEFERREPGNDDVLLEVLYCGICHTDLVLAADELNQSIYPMVPGHEIIGRVLAVGESVTRFQPGEIIGVGCVIDSCRQCSACSTGDEHYCAEGFTLSFNSVDRSGQPTYGGYSSHYTVDQKYALKIPAGLDPAGAAPLLCGGITVYNPLRRYGIGAGHKVGVLGLGGLGHLGIKFAHALGAHTVMFTSTPGKAADAQHLGADEVVVTGEAANLEAHLNSFDLILNTVSATHDINGYLPLLKREGCMCLVGVPTQPLPVNAQGLVFGDHSLSGSFIGGVALTEDMLEFCAKHDITADIELVDINDVNTAWERLENNDVKYRFVVDLKSLR
jgi:uncharacterized zinc-type alcohol dehydrogenase-like protein